MASLMLPTFRTHRAHTDASDDFPAADTTLETGMFTSPRLLGSDVERDSDDSDKPRPRDILILFARCAATFGTPLYEMESLLQRIAGKLGFELEDTQIVMYPGLVMMDMMREGRLLIDRYTFETNLEKLGRVHKVAETILNADWDIKQEDLDDWHQELHGCLQEHEKERPWYMLLGHVATQGVVAASTYLVFFPIGGAWNVLIAFLLGCMAKLAVVVSYTSSTRVQDFAAAACVSFLASCLHDHICFFPVVISALNCLLPGIELVHSVMDLITRNTVCGGVGLIHASVIVLLVAFGMLFGNETYRILRLGEFNPFEVTDRVDETCFPVSPMPLLFRVLLVGVMAIGSAMYLGASLRKQTPLIAVVSIAAYTVYSLYTLVVSSAQESIFGMALASFVAAAGSNCFSAHSRRLSSTVMMSPFLLWIVPVSLGLEASVSTLIGAEGSGAMLVVRMLQFAFAMSAGIVTADVLVPPCC